MKISPRRFTPVGLVVAMLLSLVGVQAVTGTAAHASTNQFHGVNWADPSDNFVTGDLQPVGLSDTDSYATVYAKSTAAMWNTVISKYQNNSHVYFGIMNEPWGYSATDEDNIAAAWVAHFSQIPRG